MSILLDYKDVKRQSEAVWGQFGESVWLPYTQINVRLPNRRDPEELRECGVGRVALLAAMGASLEEHVELIKANRDKVDVITCDKGFGTLLEHGIKADYVQLCDCNIQYKWLEPYVNETKGVKLLATTYANVEWTTRWQGPIYFYLNKDALQSEKKFLPLLGVPDTAKLRIDTDTLPLQSARVRIIPAGSNVSNAMLIFMIGADEENQHSFSGYERFLLTGYDYSFRPSGPEFACKTGNYYAFANPVPKRHYMNHRTMLDINGDPVATSENLLFSAKWLYSYVTAYNLPVINCSGRGMLDIPLKMGMAEALGRINASPEARSRVRRDLEVCRQASSVFSAAQENLTESRRVIWR